MTGIRNGRGNRKKVLQETYLRALGNLQLLHPLFFFFLPLFLTVPSEGEIQHNTNKAGSYIPLPTAPSQRMRGVWCEEQLITLTWLQGHDRRSSTANKS